MPWGRPSCMSRSLTNYTLYYLKKFHNIDDIFIDYFSHISMHVFANCFPDLWLLICPCWCVLVKNFKCRIPLLVFVCGRFLRWWRRSCTGGRLYWLYKGKLRVQRQEGRPCLVLIHWWLLQALNFFYCILQDSLMDLRGYRSTVKEPYISFISFYRERDAK